MLQTAEAQMNPSLLSKHPVKRWEVSIIEMQAPDGLIYKVNRTMADMAVSETRMFATKELAKAQFEEWLE